MSSKVKKTGKKLLHKKKRPLNGYFFLTAIIVKC